MYEARQNKERVSRRIDADETRQRPKPVNDIRNVRNRIVPEELVGKIPSHSRSRTLEETKIDLFGFGSAFNSLLTAPVRTVKNAVRGFVSDFPSRHEFKTDAVVQGAINNAWAQSLGDFSERFGWIVWNSNNNTYDVPVVDVGDEFGVDPSPKPADAPPVFHVGEFHIHPPLNPNNPQMANHNNEFPIGPSMEDEHTAQEDKSPGIVRDFNTSSRLNGTTDYTYGPWKRI